MIPNTLVPEAEHEFPSSDGKRMAENTRQYEAIVTLKGNIEAFAPTDAFVAGDHLIYVDPNDRTACQAPDVYVAFGRPREHRPCYKLWQENRVFPQVIFEVLAPSNTDEEMRAKRKFYFGHGAEEYYEFDPEAGTWIGFVRDPVTGVPEPVPEMDGHTSPRLGMRFEFQPLGLRVFRPDGTGFLSFQELEDDRIEQRRRAAEERLRAAEERLRAAEERNAAERARRETEEERLRADAEHLRAEAERLRADAEQIAAERARREAEEERNAADQARREVEEERLRADAERDAAERARHEAEEERLRADEAQRRAEEERDAAERARREAERVRALLRAAGIDPDANPSTH